MNAPTRILVALGGLVAGIAAAPPLPAQGPAPSLASAAPADTSSCEGRRISAIDIQAGRPAFKGVESRWRSLARAVGLHHTTTRDDVINAFLLLDVGQTCSEKLRAESERLVRDQPFIADAKVVAVPDGAGGVILRVTTVDEIGPLVSGQTHGLNIQALSLGNGNIRGEGLSGRLFFERGFSYRTGFGVRMVEYAMGGRPYLAILEAHRHPLGHYVNTELAHPFVTDIQRVAWHVGFTSAEDYPSLGRPAGDPLALQVKARRWDVSSIARVFGTSTVGLLGIGANGLDLTPADSGIVVDPNGLLPDTGQTLRNRYMPFRVARLGLIGGLRRVNFTRVHGFDALVAAQDVASGLMTGMYAAKGIKAGGENDEFLSGALYAGMASSRALVATQGELEGRRDPTTHAWDSVIGSGRAAFYTGSAPGLVFMADDRYSTGTKSRVPMQLSIGDVRGGIIGYRSSGLAGARRNAAHAEVRWSGEALVHNADVGVATFGESASIWAGDAPYGQTATRTSVGVSIMAAYPTHSKRLYRADFGFPLTRAGQGGGKFEVRFSSEDRTNTFWREPDDVRGARTGAIASSLFVAPQQ